jgi:hypothetical protein
MSDTMNVSATAPEANSSGAINSISQKQEQPGYTLPYYATEVDAVHESIQRAIDLVQHYSEQAEYVVDEEVSARNSNKSTDKSSSFANTNPDEIYQQLDTARNQITKSWQTLYTSFHSQNDGDDDNYENDNRGNPLTEQEQIRIAYLNMITDSFGNVLANLHDNNENNVNVDVLADCLQSGYDLLTQFNSSSSNTWYEKDFVWNDQDDDDHMDDGFDNDDDDDDDNDDVETPHERHRQQLGFQEVH